MNTVVEPERPLCVAGDCDVLVAGGGIAGVAAAVAAARTGAAVTLLEKESLLGGLATLGNVTIWLPLCDGHGRQVTGGLAEELLKLAVADLRRDNPPAGLIGIPPCWQPGGDPAARQRTRFQVSFNPAAYGLALEKWLIEAGVRLLYDTRVCAVRREEDRISHLLVENKSGRTAIACRTVVDATGDADLCFLAGEATESLDSNVLCGWFYYLQDGALYREPLTNGYAADASRAGGCGPFFRGDDGRQVTDQILGSRERVRARLDEVRRQHPEADIQLIMPATIACFRMTRRLIGSLSPGERHQHEYWEDSVGFTGDWRQAGPVYAIPYRSLCGARNSNLLAAGRCISVDTTLWDVTRAIPACVVTGEAAGVAAALAAKRADGKVAALDIARLQNRLREGGVLLDPALVHPAGPCAGEPPHEASGRIDPYKKSAEKE